MASGFGIALRDVQCQGIALDLERFLTVTHLVHFIGGIHQ
jgi:hypothetical protein